MLRDSSESELDLSQQLSHQPQKEIALNANERYDLLKSVFSEAVNQYESEHVPALPALERVVTTTYYSVFLQLFCLSPSVVEYESHNPTNASSDNKEKHMVKMVSVVAPALSAIEYELKSRAINTAKAYLGLAIDKKDKSDAFGKYLTAQQIVSYPRWILSANSIAGKLQIYTCETANCNGFKGVKYDCIIHTDKQKVFDFLISDEQAVESDPSLLGYTMLKQFDESSAVRRYYYTSHWLVTPRDFILYTTWRRLKDGSLLITTISPPDDRKLYPHFKGYIRATVICSCSLLKDHKVNGKLCCQLTMVNHSLLGGSLSASLVNPMTEAYPPKYVAKLKKMLESHVHI